jgi:NADPH2:quinone reductase
VRLPELAPGDVRLRTLAAAVNHTDLKIRAGQWPIMKKDPFPYTPGVEVVGQVSEIGTGVSEWLIGETVITMMQGLGGVRAERAGAYAEYVTVSGDALSRLPKDIDPMAMAAVGLVGVTAFQGLNKLGALEGRRVLVTGAAGGVGSAAVSIARALGASVVGIVTRSEQAAYVRDLGADQVIVSARGKPAAIDAESVDGVLDAVGGPLFSACVNALRAGGALSLVGAVGGGDVQFDAWQLIRPVVLTGYSTEHLSGDDLRRSIERLSDWLKRGAIKPPDYQVMGLADAADAHALLEGGGVKGRILLSP